MNDINSNSKSLLYVYTDYRDDKFIVNRRYQRKLVWTLEEKQAFIDSIIRGYSVPLFLFAQSTQTKDTEKWEILDGMQRLNAICSFIENEFDIAYEGEKGYFDLSSTTFTKNLLESGLAVQKKPILNLKICNAVMQYPLPLSYIKADDKSIETVFRRINSYGRQLSAQEIRQAGATCRFSDLVRIISSKIRGDVSLEDKIGLSGMGKISLSSRTLNYGINMDEVYWVKHKIILICNMRKSKDEEIIAYILTYILLGSKIEPTVKTLDTLYTYNELDSAEEGLEAKVNEQIAKVGFDTILQNFMTVHDTLSSVLLTSGKNFHDLLFDKAIAHGLVRSYQIVFLSLYQLLVEKKKEISDLNLLISELRNVGKDQLMNVANKEWDSALRQRKIKATVALIERAFKDKLGEDVAHECWVSQLENIFRLSKIEGAQYDFKQGLYDLDKKNCFLKEKLSDYICTLTAQVNKGPHTKGYLILGVAEKENTANRIKSLYGEDFRQFVDTKFYITGVQGEINAYLKGDEDSYSRKIKDHIKSEPINEYAKSYILTHIKFVSYYGKTVLVLELESQNEPIAYNDAYYERENNETTKVEGVAGTLAVMQRFK